MILDRAAEQRTDVETLEEAPKASPRVAIVILNWRRPDDLLACLASLERLDYPADAREVVVVDNASQNGSLERLRACFPAVTVIENGRNLGFAGGCNVGIRHAIDSGAAYVLLLNDDAEVDPSLLSVLTRVAESDRRIGALIYAVQGASDAVLAGFERLDVRAAARIASEEVFMVAGAAALWMGVGYRGLIVASLLAAGGMAYVCARGVPPLHVPRRPVMVRGWRALFRNSPPFAVGWAWASRPTSWAPSGPTTGRGASGAWPTRA